MLEFGRFILLLNLFIQLLQTRLNFFILFVRISIEVSLQVINLLISYTDRLDLSGDIVDESFNVFALVQSNQLSIVAHVFILVNENIEFVAIFRLEISCVYEVQNGAS